MTGSAEGIVASSAKEHGHVAASHAFPVNEFVSVLRAKSLAVAKLFHSTFLAQEALWVEISRIFLFHRLSTVLHTTIVRHLALKTLVECALMQGEFSEFSVVDIAFSYDSTLSV